ncbi:serine hydrolase domain-containing protein [Oceanomicrobium pacificus]|uniref:Serine hydrolase n=1 Tax=Oceanomicrobium pacificus TaxID=2692916 RepID=A0A6B0TJ72_9RHOB|nr:serine hydrolase [Oceanomicrobium pacificus]MXU64427.1 serine hydrolase [Oceanomicrobium pacificus]
MPRWIKRTLVVLLAALALLAVLAIWQRDRIERLLAVNTLFDEAHIVANFSDMPSLFFHQQMTNGNELPWDLPQAATPLPAQVPDGTGGTLDIAAWAAERSLTALVVLKDGEIVAEEYFQGTDADDLRISWSVAKSFLSALTGILVEEGAIESLDAPVTDYAPLLAKSAYRDATIRDVLQMESGVTFNEDYLDFHSDINKMGRVLALGGSMDAFAAGLEGQDRPPGEAWQYVSIDTHVIGMVLRGATGRSVPDLMEEKLIRPLGLEAGPVYLTDGEGVAFVLGGLNLRTRDYARMGLLVLQKGRRGPAQIIPANWLAESTAPSAKTAPGEIGYGYQWWVPQDSDEDEVLARGIYGQFIYINRDRGVVVAINSADRGFREPGAFAQNMAAFRALAGAAAPDGSGAATN